MRQDILTWVLVVQSSLAQLDLCGVHLGGRHPAGLVPGSFCSNAKDEVSVIYKTGDSETLNLQVLCFLHKAEKLLEKSHTVRLKTVGKIS